MSEETAERVAFTVVWAISTVYIGLFKAIPALGPTHELTPALVIIVGILVLAIVPALIAVFAVKGVYVS